MKVRNNKPEKGNKFYNTIGNGGLSLCVKGSPVDNDCDVLPNCVGFATGRFNEIIGEMKYPKLYCNAENFIEQAKEVYNLEVVNYPVLGGIMVFKKGNTLNGNDGAGHVFIVEKFVNENEIQTSESAYGGQAFYSKVRNKNNNWNMDSSYTFRGCIVNPAVGKVVYVKPVDPVVNSDIKVGDKVEVINPIVYGTNNTFAKYYEKYDVIEVKGDRAVIGIGNTVTAPISTKNIKKVGNKEVPLRKGDKVEVIKPLIYGTNDKFGVYYKTYEIIELKGDRAVIGVDGVVTTAINVNNLKRK